MKYKIILLLLSSFWAYHLQAQVYYPVVARVTQTAPYPVYLADYSNPSQTSISVQIQQNDAAVASRAIRLKMLIEGQGFLIESTDQVAGEPSLMLNYGQVYNLTSAEVANYFKLYNLRVNPELYSRPLPEGSVRFGVQVIDYQTNRPLSGVQWGAPVWITINEPPVWVMPEQEAKVTPSVNPNIVFQWAPRHTNVSDVEYEFTLKELVYNTYSMGNMQNVFLSQPAFYTTRTSATTLAYNATMPPLMEGRMYAFRVRVITKKGLEEIGLFRNFGYSEVQAFSYGDPMLPLKAPVITLLRRDELSNIAVLTWTGDPAHTLFTVAYREKNHTGAWAAEKVAPAWNEPFHTYTFNRLDPAKNYEIRVGAHDRYEQSAYSSSVFLDSLTLEQEKNIELKGRVVWAFGRGEDALEDKSSLFSGPGIKGRSLRVVDENERAADKTHPLAGAEVSLISSEHDDLSVQNLASRSYTLIRKLKTGTDGSFIHKTTNLELLKNLRNIYLLADYGEGPFDKTITPIGLFGAIATPVEVDQMVLKARSVRYSPRLAVESRAALQVEESELYRLKGVVLRDSYLQQEGNIKQNRKELVYNGQIYQQVADFSRTSSVGGLVSNSYFNDQFILRVKEKNKREVIIPVASLENAPGAGIAHIIDHLPYAPVPFQIKGQVTRSGKPLAGVLVQALGMTVKTDARGKYSLNVPLNARAGSRVEMKVIDPVSADHFIREHLTFQGSDAEKNFELKGEGYYLEARVLIAGGEPAAGAMVRIGNQLVRTDGEGWFYFSGMKERRPSAVIVAYPGYEEMELPFSSFLNRAVPSEAAFTALVKHPAIPDKKAYYQANFTQAGWVCSDFYTAPPLVLRKTYMYRIITFKEKTFTGLNIVNTLDSAEYISASLKVNGETVKVSKGKPLLVKGVISGQGGYIGRSASPVLKVNTFNAAGQPAVVEEEFLLNIPETAGVKDTTTFLVQLKEGVLFKGVVLDSTIYIEGLHVPGTVKNAGQKLNPVAEARIEISDINVPVISDAKGHFEVVVPVNRDLVFNLTKPGFTKTTRVIPREKTNDFKKNPKDFYMMQLDTLSVPNITRLMGFDVEIERMVINSSDVTNDADLATIIKKGNRTYKISGRIRLDGSATASLENIFHYSTYKTLAFKELLVSVERDENGDGANAVLVYNSANLNHTQYPAKLFGYAPVMFKGVPQNDPFIRLEHVEGHPGYGKVLAAGFDFTQGKMGGLNFGKMRLADVEEESNEFGKLSKEEEEEGDAPAPGENVTAFSSLPLAELSDSREFRIIFGSKVSNKTLGKEGIDSTRGTYYHAEFAATHIPGIYSAMNMYVLRETATLNKDGVKMEGYFSLPKLWKFKNSGALLVNSLQVDQKFNLKSLSFSKNPNSKKSELARFSVGSKWILYVNSLKVTGNFTGYHFGGAIHTDKENYLTINSFGVTVSDGEVHPALSISTPPKGLVFKNIKFTTPKGKSISFARNVKDQSYEVDAAFKMEFSPSGKSNATLERLAKKIFPLDMQRFLWSTSGKLVVALAADKSLTVGPVSVKVRRLLYTKGGAITKDEISSFLALTQEEIDQLSNTDTFDKANKISKEEQAGRDAVSADALAVDELAEELAEEDPAAKWAFGFAGGIQVGNSKVKGMKFDSDLSFFVGDFGEGTEFQMNDIAIKLESTGFKVLGKVKIKTDTDRSGFEGEVEIETVKRKFAGTFKFYELYYTSGNSKGFELGASLLASTNIVMGSVTWTSIGGGFDINTGNGTYKFFFNGSATNTGVPKSLVEYRDINVTLAFDTQKCGGLPVIKGRMSLFINNQDFCRGDLEFDFCSPRVVGRIDCERELVTGVKAKVNAVLTASADGFLTGCYIRMSLLGYFESSAMFALGIRFKTTSQSAQEVSDYVKTLPAYLKASDNVTFTGAYFNYAQWASFKNKGNVSIKNLDVVGWEVEALRVVTFNIGVNFDNGNFRISSQTESWLGSLVSLDLRVSILGYGIRGYFLASIAYEGGYTKDKGWHVAAAAKGELKAYNSPGEKMSCNSINLKWEKHTVGYYPCGMKCSAKWPNFWDICSVKWCKIKVPLPNIMDGIGVKVCLNGTLKISYQEKGKNSGWKFSY